MFVKCCPFVLISCMIVLKVSPQEKPGLTSFTYKMYNTHYHFHAFSHSGLKPSTFQRHKHLLSVTFFLCTPCEHTRVTGNTPLAVTCSVCYPCLGSVRPPGTAPCAGGTPPSLLHRLHGNALHGPPRLPPLVTLPTQVTASAHKTGATDAAALDVAALRNRAMRAAATGQTLLTLGIPPAVRLDQSQHRGVKGYRAMRTRHLAT